jgi:hypothetical protein
MGSKAPKSSIPDELAAFLESGLSIVVATRDAEMEPDGAAASAVRIHEDRAHLTLFLYEEAADRVLRNVAKHPEIAIDLDLPTSHRACQVKGHVVSSRPTLESERAFIDRQIEGFVVDLAAIGIPPTMMEGWKSWPSKALEVRVTHVYEQTPGPGAGEPLR